jgi:pilus assembly protein CpaE
MPVDEADDTLTVQLSGADAAERSQVHAALMKLSQERLQMVEGPLEGAGEASAADVVAVIVGEDPAAAVNCLERWSQRTPPPLLLAFRGQWPLDLMREILRAGASELHQLPPTVDELELVFLKLKESRRPSRRRDRKRRVYAVTGLAGGVGLSTVAANLALALKYTLNRRVAILDLDLQNGGINLVLHLEPVETIASLAQAIERLDSIRLEGALTKHPAGIYLLAAPLRIEQADLVSEATVAAVLDLMRQLFDVVVVDCGRRVNDSAMAAWERSHQVLYVTDQNLSSARRVPRFMQLYASLELPGVEARLVLNRFVPRSGATREALAAAAGVPIFAEIPRDDHLVDELQLHNQDLWRLAPASQLARAFENLARRLESEDEVPAAPRLVERLMGAIGVRV